MTTAAAASRQRWFLLLDRAFCVVWMALPLLIWASLNVANDPSQITEQLPADLANCSQLVADPSRMSPAGRVMYWGLFAFQISIYFVLLGFLHVVMHRFAKGRIFAGETLTTVRNLGLILIAWPVLETAVTNAVAFGLKTMGDIPLFVPSYAIDVAPIAVGLFLLALRYVLEHAIAIQSENDLTI